MKFLRKENIMCFRTKVSLLMLALFVGAGVFSMSVAPIEAVTDKYSQDSTATEAVKKSVAPVKAANFLKYIEQLKKQIAALQAKLKSAQGQQQDGEWCHTFRRDLKYGNAGAEVIALQTALKKQGFTGVSRDKIGRFGVYTASAVVGFQEKYSKIVLKPLGLKHGTGFVGKLTRTKLNFFYGCGIAPVPPVPPVQCTPGEEKKYTCPDGEKVDWCTCGEDSKWVCRISPQNQCKTQQEKLITVISPNGNEKWQAGRTYKIRWKLTKSGIWIQSPETNDAGDTSDTENSPGIAMLDKVDIYLADDSLADGSACTENGACCYTCTNWTLIASDIFAYQGIYRWTIDDDQAIGDKYKIFIRTKGSDCFSGCVSDYSNDYFSIVKKVESACTDSDGGIEKYVKGTTCRNLYLLKDSEDNSSPTATSSFKKFCRTDRCVYSPNALEETAPAGNIDTSSRNYVKEYYCRNNKIFSKIMRCENGCENGACIKEIEELTCAAKCEAKGYDSGICRTWAISPSVEWGCKDKEISIGYTSDCYIPKNDSGVPLLGIGKTCCCKKEAQEEPICEDKCGDGICQATVCLGTGCPCAETPESCPGDCEDSQDTI
jgi:hypothetical protein